MTEQTADRPDRPAALAPVEPHDRIAALDALRGLAVLGILALAALMGRSMSGSLLGWAGLLMFIGIVFFSGSLYVLALSGTKWLGAVPPLGGVLFIIAWLLTAVAAWRAY